MQDIYSGEGGEDSLRPLCFSYLLQRTHGRLRLRSMHRSGSARARLRHQTAAFGYYQRQGYSYNIYRHRETLPLPMIPAEIETSPLSAVRYHSLRRRFYSGTGLVEWPEKTCEYILSYIGYCRGHAVEINGGAISPPHSVSGFCKRPSIHSSTRLRRKVLTLQTIPAPTRQFRSLQFCDGVIRSTWNNYLPKYTRSTEMSEGDTPGIREASAIVLGRCRVSFILDSIERDSIRE